MYARPIKVSTIISSSRKGLNVVNLAPTKETHNHVQAHPQDYPNNSIRASAQSLRGGSSQELAAGFEKHTDHSRRHPLCAGVCQCPSFEHRIGLSGVTECALGQSSARSIGPVFARPSRFATQIEPHVSSATPSTRVEVQARFQHCD